MPHTLQNIIDRTRALLKRPDLYPDVQRRLTVLLSSASADAAGAVGYAHDMLKRAIRNGVRSVALGKRATLSRSEAAWAPNEVEAEALATAQDGSWGGGAAVLAALIVEVIAGRRRCEVASEAEYAAVEAVGGIASRIMSGWSLEGILRVAGGAKAEDVEAGQLKAVGLADVEAVLPRVARNAQARRYRVLHAYVRGESAEAAGARGGYSASGARVLLAVAKRYGAAVAVLDGQPKADARPLAPFTAARRPRTVGVA